MVRRALWSQRRVPGVDLSCSVVLESQSQKQILSMLFMDLYLCNKKMKSPMADPRFDLTTFQTSAQSVTFSGNP